MRIRRALSTKTIIPIGKKVVPYSILPLNPLFIVNYKYTTINNAVKTPIEFVTNQFLHVIWVSFLP